MTASEGTTEIIKKTDLLIKEGKLALARVNLNHIDLKSQSRHNLVELADLGRRTNMLRFSLRIMQPLIHPKTAGPVAANDKELALYAVCLSRSGAYREAADLFARIKNPISEVILYKAFNEIYQWNDPSAIRYLKQYLKRTDLSPYSRQVAQVNLVDSLLSCGETEAAARVNETLIQEITKVIDRQKYKLISGYLHLQASRIAILREKFDLADTLIKTSNEFLAGTKSRYELYCKNWETILGLLREPSSDLRLKEMQKIRSELESAGHWEAIRVSELYQAVITRDRILWNRILHGTSHKKFREMMTNQYGNLFPKEPNQVSSTTIYSTVGWNSTSSQVFQLDIGQFQIPEMIKRLFEILASEIYHPVPLLALFSNLYPGEYFDIDSSIPRVKQLILRLRTLLQEHQIPLKLIIDQSKVRLLSDSGYSVLIQDRKVSLDTSEAEFYQVVDAMGDKPFKSLQVQESLGLSLNKVKLLIDWGLKKKFLLQLAGGRSTKYKVKATVLERRKK